ncbi:MAG: tetratricopeptide repeat protein [Pyrinomonadaceae bacterium]
MSDPIVKGVKRSSTRPSLRHNSTTSSAKNRSLGNKSATRPKPIAKRSAAEKAPARKATKLSAATSAKSKTAKKSAKSAPARKAAPKNSVKAVKAKTASRKPAPVRQKKKVAATSKARAVAQPKKTKPVAAKVAAKNLPARKSPARQQTVRSAPTQDEAAALKAFERAHKEFARGRFAEARNQFRQLVDKHPGASEVAARARTYLAIAEARLRTESTLPRDADSLYDRGVIELNRGEYVAAQEMFERALKREPEAAHIHYGLAATRARLGSIDLALQSLQKALDLQPSLRVRAQHDQDLTSLRNDPDFEQLVFTPRF